MATEREIKFKISADADGGEKIQKLADEIETLVKSGGDAAPAFKKFGEELEKLGNQNDLVNQFAELKTKTLEVKTALSESADATQKSAAALRERSKDLAEAASAESRSRDAVEKYNAAIREAQVGVRQARADISALKAAIAESGSASEVQTLEYKKANIELKAYKAALDAAKSGLDSVVPAQTANAEALKAAQVELNKASQAFDKNRAATSELKTELQTVEGALQQVRDGMSKAGVSSSSLAGEYAKINTAVERLTAVVNTEKDAIERATAAKAAEVEALRVADAAYKQKTETIRASAQVLAEEIQLARSQNQIALETERATLAAAKAKNNEKAVTEAMTNIRRIESQQIQLEAQALRQEANASELLTAAKQSHLAATNRVTAATEAEIAAERIAVSTKRNLAEATDQAAKNQNSLADSTSKSGGAMSSLIGYAKGAIAPLTALVGLAEGLFAFARVNVELENVGRTLKLVTGSTEGAKKEMTFIKAVANDLGLELVGTAKAYSQFAAATKGSALEGEQTRKIFEAVARSMSIAGRSAAETEGALNALGQMVSKGVVQMEELRGQLGDRLPGAMKIAADSSGITTAQLIKMVESGQVLAEDLLPKLADGLNKSFSEPANAARTTAQEFNRFKNAISETFEAIGNSGVLKGLIAIGAALGTVVTGVGALINILTQSFGAAIAAVVVTIKDFAVALATLDFEGFKENVGITFKAFVETVDSAMQSGAEAIERFKNLIPGFGEETKKVVDANKAVVETTAQSGVEAAIASKNWLGLTAAYTQLQKAIEDSIKVSEKQIEARKAESDIVSQLNSLRGDEVEKLRANVEAAESMEKALVVLSNRRRAELLVLEQQLAAQQQYIAQNKDESKEHAKQVEELQKLIDARRADYERALAQAKASGIVAAEAKAEQQAHADNSKQMNALKVVYQELTVKVDELRAKKKQGVEVSNELAAAEKQLASASFLYRDAVKDQASAINANIAVKREESNLAQLGIKLAIEAARSDYEVAKAKGDEAGARRAANEMRRLEIELAKLQAQLLKAEAQATLEMVRVKREEAQARGTLTKAMELELKAQELSGQVKQKQAQIQEEVASRMQRLSTATTQLAQATTTNNAATENSVGPMGRAANAANNLTTSYDRATQAANNLAAAQAKGLRPIGNSGKFVDNQGFITDADGNKSSTDSAGNGTLAYDDAIWNLMWDYQYSGKRDFTEQEKIGIKAQYEAAKGNLEVYQKSTMRGGMNSFDLDGARSAEKMYNLSRAMYEAAYGGTINRSGGNQGNGPAGGLRSYNVNITLNGQSTNIRTASETDAQALTQLLGQLGTDKSRTY